MVVSRSVHERHWRTNYELCPIPLSILLLATIGAKLIGPQDSLQVGKWAVHDLQLPDTETPTPKIKTMTKIDTLITEMQPILDRTISLENCIITNNLSGGIHCISKAES